MSKCQGIAQSSCSVRTGSQGGQSHQRARPGQAQAQAQAWLQCNWSWRLVNLQSISSRGWLSQAEPRWGSWACLWVWAVPGWGCSEPLKPIIALGNLTQVPLETMKEDCWQNLPRCVNWIYPSSSAFRRTAPHFCFWKHLILILISTNRLDSRRLTPKNKVLYQVHISISM